MMKYLSEVEEADFLIQAICSESNYKIFIVYTQNRSLFQMTVIVKIILNTDD